MSGATTMDGLLIRDRLSWEGLRRVLSRATGRPEAEILPLGQGSVTDLAVELYLHDVGFQMDVSLYKLPAEGHEPLAFAARVAAVAGCAVLHAPEPDWGCSPTVWVLIEPDGRSALVDQVDLDAEDIEIDLRTTRALPVSSFGR